MGLVVSALGIAALSAAPARAALMDSGTWQPSLPMLTASVLTGLLNGGTTQMAIRFTSVLGDSQVDDVFVDPRMH